MTKDPETLRHSTEATQYTDWEELRGELVQELGPERIAQAQADLHSYVRAYHLAEVRKQRELTQAQVAEAMGLTQGRVSQIENGNVGESEVETLTRYVAALGGRLRLMADFGDDLIQLT